jgi:hypothetical protein
MHRGFLWIRVVRSHPGRAARNPLHALHWSYQEDIINRAPLALDVDKSRRFIGSASRTPPARNKRILGCRAPQCRDEHAIVAEGQARMLRDAPSRDWAGRPAEEIAPLSRPQWR